MSILQWLDCLGGIRIQLKQDRASILAPHYPGIGIDDDDETRRAPLGDRGSEILALLVEVDECCGSSLEGPPRSLAPPKY
jgi:hypothetical protein